MKIMLSAGETSGDLHGAAIARELKTLDEDIALVGFGGDNMEKAGVSLWANYKSYNVMGVLEVILNLRRILKLLDYLTEKMKEEKPDLLVLIDYPDFNWRLAKRAKELGIKVFSYIPPSAWAWRKGRAMDCAKIADEFVAIFPHELPPYLEAGAKISFLGNPLVDAVKPTMTKDDARQRFGAKDSDRIVLLLPGSREQEIRRIFPAMLGAAVLLKKHQPRTKFYLPIAEGIDESLLKEYISVSGAEATLTKENRYDLFQIAEFAIATSGTVVMEAALLGLPSVVLYKMSGFNFFIAKLFVHIDYFSLPNLVLQKKALTELLQDEVSPKKIFEEAKKLYVGENEREDVAKDLAKIRDILGEEGATKRIAEKILEVCKK
ncbi:MAG: lipid-A-disaccharide synthase [Selenomonadaceae bacterium]|nr:lipid-A-disaccharide synthase [Selenomonadaceae bacterium]